MSDAEAVVDDEATIATFIATLIKSGVTMDDLRALNKGHVVLPMYQLKEAATRARHEARLIQRKEWLMTDVDRLEVTEGTISKLRSAGYDKIFKVAVIADDELLEENLLAKDEIEEVHTALQAIELRAFRDKSRSLPERIEHFWGSWASVPTNVRLFYGV